MESSLSEKPERHAPRRLSDHLMLEGQMQKVHSLVDKVYSRKNLKLAWERVRANQGASGTDGIMIGEFEANLEANLERLHRELREETYQPLPVRRLEIPKRGSPGKTRPLGIPSVYDRVCQQALVNRLEPIFEKVFDPSSFGYRKGRNGKAKFKLPLDRIKSKLNRRNLYAIPTQKAVDRFKDQIRNLTQRCVPLRLGDLIATINPIIRGWGNYFCRCQVRKRFHQLDGWIIQRLYSHRAKRWRNTVWKEYPTKRLRTEFKLVSLISLISSLQIATARS